MEAKGLHANGNVRLATDIGGTFTDIALFDDKTGQLTFSKALSTPDRLVDGITAGVVKAGSDYASANLFLHGSTIAINTILERTGAKTALITTDGFRDVYEIGRINRPDAYNLFFQKHTPLIERALRFELKERVRADGEVVTPLDEGGLAGLSEKLQELGIEAAAIMFINCYANAAHEMRAKALLAKRHPCMFVTASHELSQEYREFERCSTVAANAYIGPKVRRYIGEIDEHIRKAEFGGSFLIVQSTGGLYESEQAQSQCVRMLESGPAAGVIGTQSLCQRLGIKNAIAFDMGGTTAKAGVIYKGEALTTERGLDSGDFVLVAYGGAGPLHAVDVAREIGIRNVIVPSAPGVFSAFGMLFSDLRYDYVRTHVMQLADAPFDEIEAVFKKLEQNGKEAIAATSVKPDKIAVKRALDMRYVGQEHPVTVELPMRIFQKQDRAAIKQHFDDDHMQRYGTSAPNEHAEIVSLRVTVAGLMKKPPQEKIGKGASRPPRSAATGLRHVWFDGQFRNTPTYRRTELLAGNTLRGPALIEEHASTTVLMPGDRMTVDDYGNLTIRVARATARARR
jgi:N-methylhydantoinase A/oxoprolinase/acetone carboxylase beta subunit